MLTDERRREIEALALALPRHEAIRALHAAIRRDPAWQANPTWI